MRIIIFILLFPATTLADDSDWAFVLSPVTFPTHTLIHEGGHALGAKIIGHDITAFKPYPHMHDGGFYFGRVETWSPNPATENEQLIFLATPYVIDIVMFAATDAMLSSGAVNIKTFWGTTLYLFGIAAPLFDFAKGYVCSRDWQKIRGMSNGRAAAANILGFAALAVGLYRFVVHTRELFKR